MNVIANLPRWAQAPTQRFLEKAEVPGTQSRPLDQEGFEDSFKLASGVVSLAAHDEVPGEDLAMGQPGVVQRNGVTVYYQGDSSNSSGEVEAVLTGKRRGIEYATYVQARDGGFSALQMVNDDGGVEVKGGVVDQTAGGIDGYLLSGYFSV